MADNIEMNAGSGGDTIAADEVDAVKYQRVKVVHSVDGVVGVDTSADDPLPVAATLQPSSGVDIGDVRVTSQTPGTSASNLGKATDAAAGATDTGVAVLVVRKDAAGTIAGADNDYTPLQADANGALRVTGGGGGTEYSEDAATPSPIVGTATLMERDDVPAPLTPIEGDWVGQRSTAEGALWTQDFNSDAIAASLAAVEADTGTIDTSLDTIKAAIATEGSALGSGVLLQGDDGTDRKNINVDATTGDLQVDVTNTITETNSGAIKTAVEKIDDAISGSEMQCDVVSVIPGTGATNSGKAADSVAGATDTGVALLAVREDVLSDITPAEDDYTLLKANKKGALYVSTTEAKDGGWDTAALAVQRGKVIGATATSDQELLAQDGSNLYNLVDVTVTIFSGTAAPGAKAYVALYHGTSGGTEILRVYAPVIAGAATVFTTSFRQPDRGSVNQAVTAKLSAALGTNGEYSVNVHAYKTSS